MSVLAIGKSINDKVPEGIDKIKSKTIPTIIDTLLAKENVTLILINKALDLWKFYDGLSDL